MMKKIILVASLTVLVCCFSYIQADEKAGHQTQAFVVENMTCATCPITVRAAMSRVDGVERIEVDFETKTAVATYDPAIASAQDIADASTSVGFPAKLIEAGGE